ncbi:ABC transporter ATP-binding protein [Paenibacillus cymbidii]|uniref:ABC transporter ATP-binding protein n=1 Tax=Paenibacillus cymbidii TaxID=1639034 RepID=UPI001A9B669C|nr:ABC transporter ATP-binding protein [Paenibacillus cymbidii]
MKEQLLSVRNLVTAFRTGRGTVRAVDGISFDVAYGETVGIVGESGSGKSVTSLSVMGLVKHPGVVLEGSIRFRGQELAGCRPKEWRAIRGKEMAMIFQEPMTSLNPVLTIGEQLAETIRLHQSRGRMEAMKRAADLLEKVGIPMAEARLRQYPHQLSGGMRQRVMIAMALSCDPQLLIADEPTTALDVTIQAQILDLLKRLNRFEGMGLLMVTHDLGVVAETCERVIVMYAGRIVEQGPVADVFRDPRHPYTAALLQSIPVIGKERGRLFSIPGSVPSPHAMPAGCRFHPRCAHAFDRCTQQMPQLREAGNGRMAACWYAEQLGLQPTQSLAVGDAARKGKAPWET